jgi:uncharacterized protein YjiS (DUF1127 family)
VTAPSVALRARPAGCERARTASYLRRTLAVLDIWRQRLRSRRELVLLDDRSLRDIGLTRYDAVREARKPFWRE